VIEIETVEFAHVRPFHALVVPLHRGTITP
jgi:hypothetical protein